MNSKVRVTKTPLLYLPRLNFAAGLVLVTNTTSSTIDGPIYLALGNLPNGVQLLNAAGSAPGAPYLKLTNAPLAPGATALGYVSFRDPGKAKIEYSTTTYSGSL